MSTTDALTTSLSAFARTLAHDHDVSDVLLDLAERVAAVLPLASVGVSLVREGLLRHIVSLDEAAGSIEVVQEATQRGPCVDAVRGNAPVASADLHAEPERWPEVGEIALALGVVAVAGIPLNAGGEAIGSLDLFHTEPRHWSEVDLARAQVFADMATGYIIHASQLRHERRTNEQLQRALDNRVVIEQAKGILSARHGISVEQAWVLLRDHARRRNATSRSVAEAVVKLGLRP